MFYIEYVPISDNTTMLVPTEKQLTALAEKSAEIKSKINDMTVLCFPGDEKYMGGCLAAGRGFFHINPKGFAEPCPFSPFSKLSLKNSSLIDAIKSPFFKEIQKISASDTNHIGGCTLYMHRDEVSKI